MNVLKDIQHKKDLFKLPYNQDQLEYWGPVNHVFADSFLTMGNTFIYQYFNNLNSRFLKLVFSSFVEMVQNVSEYNEENYRDNPQQSYIRLKDEGGKIVIATINKIRQEDFASVKAIFENAFAIAESELQNEYKRLLLKGGSLGLIMLRKLKDSYVEYSLAEDNEGEIWLSIELKMNYGNT